MRHRKRLDNLRDNLRALATNRGRAVRTRACVGANWHRLIELVLSAVRAQDEELVAEIINHCDDYAARSRPNQDGTRSPHGFIGWIMALGYGWGTLPEELPHAFLTAWRDGYQREFGWKKEPWSPHAFCRCEDCRLMLPNCAADGSAGGFNTCPACNGTRISDMNFFRPGTFSLDGGRTILT